MMEPVRVWSPSAPAVQWEKAASQVLRAVRSHRSQVAFSRRLGYRSNPVADWEAGRRFPTAAELLRACQKAGTDVREAFSSFDRTTARYLGDADDEGVAEWLSAWRGSRTLHDVADRCSRSRYAVGRWLNGSTRPRVPDFLRLVEALTGRASDLVAELVPAEHVPALAPLRARSEALRRLQLDVPWAGALLMLLQSAPYQDLPGHRPGWLSRRLGISPDEEIRSLQLLEAAGAVAWDGDRYRARDVLDLHAHRDDDGLDHWHALAARRMERPGSEDRFSGMVFLTDDEGYARVQEAVRKALQAVGTPVAEADAVGTRVGLLQVAVVDLTRTPS